MRRLTLIVAAALVAGCYGSPAGSAPPGSTAAASVARTTTAAPSAPPTATPTTVPTPSSPAATSPSPSKAAGPCEFPRTVFFLSDLGAGLPKTLIVGCLGRSDVRVTGWLAETWGFGALANGVTPAWLGEVGGLEKVLWLRPRPTDGCFADTDCVWMFLHSPEATGLPLSPDRWVTVTGHFDDAAAATCRWTDPKNGTAWPLTPAEAVAYCRGNFVVTAIEDAAAPTENPMP